MPRLLNLLKQRIEVHLSGFNIKEEYIPELTKLIIDEIQDLLIGDNKNDTNNSKQ